MVKLFTARDFTVMKNFMGKIIDVSECLNYAVPFKDWEIIDSSGKPGAKQDYKKRFRYFFFLVNVLNFKYAFISLDLSTLRWG